MNTMTVKVPLTIRRRGGRKVVIAPEGDAWAPPRARVDSTLVKALARAIRWRRMLEEGRYASVADLAVAEKINQSYLCRVLRLTLLSPEFIESFLDGRQYAGLQLETILKTFPDNWLNQKIHFLERLII